ncbi:MAG: winged helix DNA-binding protein [Sphingomicrobium sp.]
MNASTYPDLSPSDYAGPPPVLIAASSDQARARASIIAQAAGYRTATVEIGAAIERINIQGAASAIWVEIDRDGGAELDELLERVELESREGRMPAVISAPIALIDPITARIRDSAIELLIDGSAPDRTAALAVVIARRTIESRLHDVTRDSSSARLRQLSDEVGRIAATLARLSVVPGAPASEVPDHQAGEAPQVSLEQVRQVIRARRLRSRYFDEEMFADPAWDMLLDLLQAEIAQHRVPVSSLCIAAAVPATTALRWIKTMTDAGLFRRRADPHDGRRVFVELAPQASEALRRYFKEVGKVVVV